MSLAKRYSKGIRSNLNYFPVWRPGDEVQVGDIGEIGSGIFQRQTSVQKLFPNIAIDLKEDANKESFHFAMRSSVAMKAGAKEGEVVRSLTGSEVSAEVQFGKQGGMVFDAQKCAGKFIYNLYEVRNELMARRKEWPRGHVLITHVEQAEKYAAVLAEGGGASFEISGKANAVRNLEIADLSVRIVGSRGVSFQQVGSGPILFIVYGFRSLFRRPRLLQSSDAEQDPVGFDYVSARDPEWDE